MPLSLSFEGDAIGGHPLARGIGVLEIEIGNVDGPIGRVGRRLKQIMFGGRQRPAWPGGRRSRW